MDNNKLANFVINEITPREKKYGRKVPPHVVGSLFGLMTEHNMTRNQVRMLLDFGLMDDADRTEHQMKDVAEILLQFVDDDDEAV